MGAARVSSSLDLFLAAIFSLTVITPLSLATLFPSSTRSTHKSVSKTSLVGSGVPLGQSGSSLATTSSATTAAAADAPRAPPTRSASHTLSVETNRKTAIVASLKGRARVGLQVRILRRVRSLRVEEGREVGRRGVGRVAVVAKEELLVVDGRLGVDEVAEVEVGRERERCGVVTSRSIVVVMAGVGGIEKPAVMEKAICISGLWHAESSAEVEASKN